jgi:cytochrome c-type biogenesis protein CcmH/NrfG
MERKFLNNRHAGLYAHTLISLALLLGLAGCAGGPTPTASEEAAAIGQTQDAGRAVATLLAQADSREAQAQWERAAAVLERALRIEPRNARLWYRLARIRWQQGRFGMAQNLAHKSLALVGDDKALKQQNNALITAARRGELPTPSQTPLVE